jgi:Carboxypeptidase regulatory-like domain/TonB-dependent Receptor Plug Domain
MVMAIRIAASKLFAVVLSVGVVVLLAPMSLGQQLTGTISGIVNDSVGAVVPNAHVVLKNEASGDERPTVTEGDGHFTITAVQPASYTLTVSAQGFTTWQEPGIVMGQGDHRTVPNIQLKVGTASETVQVISSEAGAMPLDTAEISTTLNEQMISEFPLVGRDAAELIKVMPGVAFAHGSSQGSGFNGTPVGSNNGPVGNFSANGTQPNGPMALMLDGANLVDPGNAGTQIANINQDMTAEIKVLTSSFDAEYAKGPTIFQALSKSGGSSYHGEAYLYARNSMFDSIESYQKSQLASDIASNIANGMSPAQAKSTALSSLHPDEHFYYTGGNIGGPVRLPFVGFNKDRRKLFFWAGYEYMGQQPAGSVLNFNVPTTAQLSGDFSNAGVPAKAISTWSNAYTPPNANLPPGATSSYIPPSDFDPNILGILKLYPKTNITPSAANGWNNYQYVQNVPQNRWEAVGKVDYALSDNTKITGSYVRQNETDQHPIAIWWSPPWTLPYPSNVVAATTSQVVLANVTHTFNATTTNEVVFTLSRYLNPSTLANPSAVDRSKLGFGVGGLFGHTSKQIPNFIGQWGGSFPEIDNFPFDGAGFGGAFGGLKQTPAIYDNFTKLVGPHTLKLGFYWDSSGNKQSNSGADNGTYNLGGGQTSTTNTVADLVLGHIQNYQQESSIPIQNIQFHQWSIYAQDSFKANKQLTLNFGLRFDHEGQWYGNPGGMQVWDPASYVNSATAPANTGLLWNGIDHKIPTSGFVSPLFYYTPRVGLAYDIMGDGKTVFRAGLGVFRYQVSTEVCSACGGPLGSFQFQTPTSFVGYANISQFTPPGATTQNGSNVYALQQGDNRTPYTEDWNATISREFPFRSLFQVSYIGNRSYHTYVDGSNGRLDDINNVPLGQFFQPDPATGQYVSPNPPSGANYPNFNANDFRPLLAYQEFYLLQHTGYAKYNSAQVSWQKQTGPVTFLTNYTFSKVLGIWDYTSNNGQSGGTTVNPLNFQSNYGPLAYDHTHILNLVYVWHLPSPLHGNPFLAGAVNGWELSGYTSLQSGAPLQPNLSGNLNTQWPGSLSGSNLITLPNGLQANSINPSTWLGTNAPQILIPKVTCNPGSHLSSGQYFNPSCFTPPAYGQQGTLVWPYSRLPGYFNSDLGLYKNFHVHESQNVQFRVTATNFLNHPLRQFGLAGNSDQQLSFIGSDSSGQSLSPTNTNSTTTGKPAFTTGQRFVLFTVKYLF